MKLPAGRAFGLADDLRAGLRSLRRSGSFSAWVIGSLATGMAVTIAALALLNAAVLLPFEGIADQDRLVRVAVSENCGRPDCWRRMSTPADYRALQDGLPALDGLAAYSFGDVTIAAPQSHLYHAIAASPDYFQVLGVRPALGRTFDATDAASDAAVVVLAHRTWTADFGSDRSVLGRSIKVGDGFAQVIGVAPPFFAGVDRTRPGTRRSMTVERGPDIWVPSWVGERLLPQTDAGPQSERGALFVGRLHDGADIVQVQAQASVVAQRLAALRSATPAESQADVRRVWRVNPGTWRFGAVIILPIPILVLLIACVNAANLMTARGTQRQREIAIRLAIGAGRRRIVRLLLAESALLAGAATALALPVAKLALALASAPLGMPIPFDVTVLTATIAAAAFTTLTFGLAPALRVSAQQPSSTLGTTSRGDARPGQSRTRGLLVIAQVALSLALLVTAWQLIATVRGEAVTAGVAPNRLMLARFDLRPLGLASGEASAFYRELIDGVRRLPGVEAAAFGEDTAIWTFANAPASTSLTVWRDSDRADVGRSVSGGFVSARLFDAVGLRMIAGRAFTETDGQSRPQVAIVNETAARSLAGSPIGTVLHIARPGQGFAESFPVLVVGVVEATREPRLEPDEPPSPRLFLPAPLDEAFALTAYVRTHDDAAATAGPLRELVGRIAPRVPVLEVGSLQEFNERSYATALWLARAAGVLGLIGLLLATAGLYSVTSYVVAMRSREIAIRLAIGARPETILGMILGQAMRIALFGLFIGGGAALVASRVLQSEYHAVRRLDGSALAAAAALFITAMLVASAIPARRAARVDPIENLKEA